MKTHQIAEYDPGLEDAYIANGLVGLRIPQIPLPGGTALLNGYVGKSPEKGVEEYGEAPYPVGLDIQLDKAWLSKHRHRVQFKSQECDFSCGEIRSQFEFAAGDTIASVEVLTFCSRTEPTLTLQEVAVRINRECELLLRAQIDQRDLMGNLLDRCMPGIPGEERADRPADAVLHWESRGGLTRLGASYVTEFEGDDLREKTRNEYGHEEEGEFTSYIIDARPGKRYALRQYGSLVPSTLHEEPHWQASRQVRMGLWYGFEKLRALNASAWKNLWRARPVISGGDDRWQEIVDAAFFYTHSSVHSSSPQGIAPFALSRRQHLQSPAECYHNVNNDAYTNMMCCLVLEEATGFADQLGYSAPDNWKRIRENLLLLVDPENHVLELFEGALQGDEISFGRRQWDSSSRMVSCRRTSIL
ncbi:MAG: hypothetical protein ACLFWL_14035 [Candidatus Brocadiia bacterium]